jgi:hypothetical protein
MTTNLTLITSIVLTAAVASAGTYYVTTRVDPGTDNPVETAEAQPMPTANPPAPQPAQVVVAANNKPIEINVKTEVVQKHRSINPHRGPSAGSLSQPHFGIFQGK